MEQSLKRCPGFPRRKDSVYKDNGSTTHVSYSTERANGGWGARPHPTGGRPGRTAPVRFSPTNRTVDDRGLFAEVEQGPVSASGLLVIVDIEEVSIGQV